MSFNLWKGHVRRAMKGYQYHRNNANHADSQRLKYSAQVLVFSERKDVAGCLRHLGSNKKPTSRVFNIALTPKHLTKLKVQMVFFLEHVKYQALETLKKNQKIAN